MLKKYQEIEQKLLTYPLEHGQPVPEPYAAALIRQALVSPDLDCAPSEMRRIEQILLLQLLLRLAPTETNLQEKITYTNLLDNLLHTPLHTPLPDEAGSSATGSVTRRSRSSIPTLLTLLLHHCNHNLPLTPSYFLKLLPSYPPTVLRLILLHADLLPYLGPNASRLPSLLPTATAQVPDLDCATN